MSEPLKDYGSSFDFEVSYKLDQPCFGVYDGFYGIFGHIDEKPTSNDYYEVAPISPHRISETDWRIADLGDEPASNAYLNGLDADTHPRERSTSLSTAYDCSGHMLSQSMSIYNSFKSSSRSFFNFEECLPVRQPSCIEPAWQSHAPETTCSSSLFSDQSFEQSDLRQTSGESYAGCLVEDGVRCIGLDTMNCEPHSEPLRKRRASSTLEDDLAFEETLQRFHSLPDGDDIPGKTKTKAKTKTQVRRKSSKSNVPESDKAVTAHKSTPASLKNDTRRCEECRVTHTPLWRKNGHGGWLCNRCGIRFSRAASKRIQRDHEPRSLLIAVDSGPTSEDERLSGSFESSPCASSRAERAVRRRVVRSFE